MFFNVLFICFLERARENMYAHTSGREAEREREIENSKQAQDTEPSAQSPM